MIYASLKFTGLVSLCIGSRNGPIKVKLHHSASENQPKFMWPASDHDVAVVIIVTYVVVTIKTDLYRVINDSNNLS